MSRTARRTRSAGVAALLTSLLLVTGGCSGGDSDSDDSDGADGSSGSGSSAQAASGGALSEDAGLQYSAVVASATPCVSGRIDTLGTIDAVYFSDGDGRRELSAEGVDDSWAARGFCLDTPDGGMPTVVFSPQGLDDVTPRVVVGFTVTGQELWRVESDASAFTAALGGFVLSPTGAGTPSTDPSPGSVYSASSGTVVGTTRTRAESSNVVVRDERAFVYRGDAWRSLSGGAGLDIAAARARSSEYADFAWAGDTLVALVDDKVTLLPVDGPRRVFVTSFVTQSDDDVATGVTTEIFADETTLMISQAPYDLRDDPDAAQATAAVESYDPSTGELRWSSTELDLPEGSVGTDVGAGAVLLTSEQQGSTVLDATTGAVIDVGSRFVVELTDEGALTGEVYRQPLELIPVEDWR